MTRQRETFFLILAILSNVNKTTCGPAMTFLRFDNDVETQDTTAVFTNVSITTCGIECYKVGFRACLGFQWRPPVDNSLYDQANQIDSESASSGLTTQSPLVSADSTGRCGLLSCVPDPSTLTTAIGSQIYLYRGKLTQTFGTVEAPQSYSMACSYAYRIYDKVLLNYTEAEKQCKADGARLLTIKSPRQEAEIQQKIQPKDSYWIGLSDRMTEGDWLFSDGTTPSYTNWDNGQPNNFVQKGEDQDCVMLFQGSWNDNQCSHKLRFICQIVFVEI